MKIDPPGPNGTMESTYDDVSRVKTITDGKGQRQTFTYYAYDRVTRIEYNDGGIGGIVPNIGTDAELALAGKLILYSYDPKGNLTSRLDNTGLTSLIYDDLNRLTREAPEATAPSIDYTYDLVGISRR